MAELVKESYTAQEVMSMMLANGLKIQDFAKTAKELKNGTLKPVTTVKVKEQIQWNVALLKYPDIVIERKTAKTHKQLAIMPSCQSMFIKNVKTNDVEPLTESNYMSFTSGMGTIEITDKDFWITSILPGKIFYNDLAVCMNNPTYIEMVKAHLAPTIHRVVFNYNRSALKDDKIEAYKKRSILYKEYLNTPVKDLVITNYCSFVDDMVEAFGLQNTRDFLNTLSISLITPKTNGYCVSDYTNQFANAYRRQLNPDDKYYTSCRPRYNMDYKVFKDYVLYSSVRMGFADNLKRFWDMWNDALQMQEDLYGKVKEKYPADLPMYHNQLAYKTRLNRVIIDNNKMIKRTEENKYLEMEIDDYVFIIPKNRTDFYDEATQQANCLASYVEKYANGECSIVFMRKKDTPTESLVTIEYRDNKVTQKYQAHNAPCTKQQADIIDIWLEKVHRREKRKENEKAKTMKEVNINE